MESRRSQLMMVLMVETSGAGGMAHYAYNLAEAMSPYARVTLATAREYELADLPSSFDRAHIFERAPAGAKMANLRNLGRLATLTARLRPTLVHVQNHVSPRAEPLLARLSRTFGMPFLISVHEVLPYERAETYRSRWVSSYRAADGLIVHSRFVSQELLSHGVSAQDVWVVHHGDYLFFREAVNLDRAAARRLLGLPQDRRLLLFFGHIRVHKGLDLLAQAWPHALRLGLPSDVDLVVAGTVAPEAAHHVVALEAAVGERLHLSAGYVQQKTVASYLTAADAVVAPYHECYTSGIVPLAFSFDLPVAATAVGSLPEHIHDGIEGVLARPGDPESLGAALVRLCAPGALDRHAAQVSHAVKSISWDSAARKTLHVYGHLVAHRGHAQSSG